MGNNLSIDKLYSAIFKVAKNINYEEKNILNFQENQLWEEMVCTILSSRVSYELTNATTEKLKNNNLLLSSNVNSLKQYKKELKNILNSPIRYNDSQGDLHISKYPFYNQKANYIASTAKSIYGEGKTIKQIIKSCNNRLEVRNEIIKVTKGFGPKQASLYLRNIGYHDQYAIFDTHILKFLFLIGILDNKINNINKLYLYEKLEDTFISFANKLNIKVPILDLSIWIVMRVYKREWSALK